MSLIRVATHNPNKLREIQQILLQHEIVGLEHFEFVKIRENGVTFEKNAVKKARTVSDLTGDWAIGDDSGLEVVALKGHPGVHSARYAGPQCDDARNRKKLLEMMKNVPEGERGARFVCVLAFCKPGQKPFVARGIWEGSIALAEKGDHGFGYDSVFIVPNIGKTAAELSAEEKNNISHRAIALRALAEHLKHER
jgi:XTP/dITP diphosphohydrolase